MPKTVKEIKKLLERYRFLKFAVVGGIGVPINFGILYGLTETGLHYVASAFIAIMVAMTVNYLLNHYWTFWDRKDSNGSLVKGWCKYAIISGISDGIYIGLMILFVEISELWYLLSAAIAMFIVMLFRYTIVNRLVWRKRDAKISQEV